MTDKLRETAQQALEAIERACRTAMTQTLKARIPECGEFAGIAQDLDFVINALREALKNEFNPDWDRVEALRESLREHMADVRQLRAALAWIASHKSSDWPERCQQMVDKAREALAQQDAQAVPQGWKLVPVEALSDHIADLRRCASMFRRRGMTATADETIKAADELEAMLNAAPTPPASRAVLTDEEVLDLWSPGLRRPALGVEKVKAFARAVIEAYERKNGIK